MKYILAAILCIPMVAQAKSMYMNTQAGGRVVITDTECVLHNKSYNALRHAYLMSSKGEYEAACWGWQDGLVHVVFADGERRAYPPDVFQSTE